MEYKKYQHIERFGAEEVGGIEEGTCVVMPKIDGTNGVVWLGDDGTVKCGSRNRVLCLESDNAGFFEQISKDGRFAEYFKKYPSHRLYGEFLIPQTIRTYTDDAWRKFYIFDVTIDENNGSDSMTYLPYSEYQSGLDEFGLDYIMPLAVVKDGSYEDFINILNNNTFLIKDGMGIGEGIVIKNYSYKNRYGRTVWAKIVASEFKEKHGSTEEKRSVESEIVDKYLTSAFIEKEYQKIISKSGGWSAKMVPMLFSSVFHEFIIEETWHFIKDKKMPTVNFKILDYLVRQKIKQVKNDLF